MNETTSPNNMSTSLKNRNPWAWIPSLYFAEGIPYAIVVTISVFLYQDLGLNAEQITFYTAWLSLPWMIKPFWSPFVDLLKTKRWWIVSMEFFIGIFLAAVAFTIPTHYNIQLTLALFMLAAFSSATHDIAADGFYMLGLDTNKQSLFVGIRSTCYRIAMIVGQGITLVVVGDLEVLTRSHTTSWSYTILGVAIIFTCFAIYHFFILPHPKVDQEHTHTNASEIMKGFVATFITFFQKKGIFATILFLLFFRLPEAMLSKTGQLFLSGGADQGGLGLSKPEIGFCQGTLGIIGLLLGGIIGGILTSRDGLKKWFWPMVWSITLPNIIYIYLSFIMPHSLFIITTCIFIEQFGYGFGFTAYMLYMLYFSQGQSETAHYALCTAFMALSMFLPNLVAGSILMATNYKVFFIIVMGCCLASISVAHLVKIDPSFGIRHKE